MPPQAPHGPRQTHTQLKPRVDLRAQPNATVLMKPPRLPGRSRPPPGVCSAPHSGRGATAVPRTGDGLAEEGQWLRAAAALTGARLSDLCPPEGTALEMTGTERPRAVDHRGRVGPSATPPPPRKPRTQTQPATARRPARAVPVTSSSSSRLCMYSGHCCWAKYSSSTALDIQKRTCRRCGARPARGAPAAAAGSGLLGQRGRESHGAQRAARGRLSHATPANAATCGPAKARLGNRGSAHSPRAPDSQRLVHAARRDRQGPPPAVKGSGGQPTPIFSFGIRR